MTIVRNTAEGQVSGTQVTAANSGGGSGTAFTTVSPSNTTGIIFSTAAVAVGTNGYRLTAVGTAAVLVDLDDTLNSSSANTRAQVYFVLPSIASQVSYPFGIRNTAANIGAADIDSTGHIRINLAVPSVVAGTFSTAALSAGVLYRAEILGTGFGTASTTITVNVYAGTTTTLVATCSVSGTTSTVFNRLRVGKVATGSATGLDMDEPAIEMGGTTEIGPPATNVAGDVAGPAITADGTVSGQVGAVGSVVAPAITAGGSVSGTVGVVGSVTAPAVTAGGAVTGVVGKTGAVTAPAITAGGSVSGTIGKVSGVAGAITAGGTVTALVTTGLVGLVTGPAIVAGGTVTALVSAAATGAGTIGGGNYLAGGPRPSDARTSAGPGPGILITPAGPRGA